MNEWMKVFDERASRYRYRHKGSGVISDTLMAIGKMFNSATTPVAKKAANVVVEKAGQKLGKVAVEKGSKKIQELLRRRMPLLNSSGGKHGGAADPMWMLIQILANKL